MTYDPEARRDTPLALKLKAVIRERGPISVRAYMEACLYDPEYGYYRTRAAIGRTGDFITAPEISQTFGELIGLWCAVVWEQMGRPARFDLIELGPGRGTLMRDALRAQSRVAGLSAAAQVHLVESNATLAAMQRETLTGVSVPIVWHSTLDVLSHGSRATVPAIVVANEWLDCTPRDQAVRTATGWVRRSIAVDERGHLVFAPAAVSLPWPSERIADFDERFREAGSGAIVEVGAYRAVPEFMTARQQAAAVVIDYGHVAPVAGDTLQAVRDHRHEHPLTSPGEADLTMQVDFTQVCCDVLAVGGLATDGSVTQVEFLGGLGIVERASRLMAANPAKAATIEAGVARLLTPNGMGTRFQALGIRASGLPPLPGFPVVVSQT